MKTRLKHTSGFTLAELLIVVAIIGVLVAIGIPIFTGQLNKARQAVCESNRSEIQNVFIIERMTDTTSSNSDILANAKRSVIGTKDTGCTVKDSKYTYKYYTENGAITSADKSDAVRIAVFCNIAGHGSTKLQQEQQGISDWIANYSGTKFGNNVIDAYVKENGGTGKLLSGDDVTELFGANPSLVGSPSQLYLKPFGATVYDSNGKAQVLDVQMVTDIPGYINSNGDMKIYALIVEEKVYAMKNSSEQIEYSYRVGGNGPTYLDLTDYNTGNKSYSTIETFIEQITKSNRTNPFQLIG